LNPSRSPLPGLTRPQPRVFQSAEIPLRPKSAVSSPQKVSCAPKAPSPARRNSPAPQNRRLQPAEIPLHPKIAVSSPQKFPCAPKAPSPARRNSPAPQNRRLQPAEIPLRPKSAVSSPAAFPAALKSPFPALRSTPAPQNPPPAPPRAGAGRPRTTRRRTHPRLAPPLEDAGDGINHHHGCLRECQSAVSRPTLDYLSLIWNVNNWSRNSDRINRHGYP
jgi:hypothetical protein